MKAIIITEELKTLNPNFFNKEVGAIETFNKLPKTFKSLTWQNGRLTESYPRLDNSIHEADGFYDVTTPSFDKDAQELGELYFNTYTVETPEGNIESFNEFTYYIVDNTQGEIDSRLEASEVSEARMRIEAYITKGNNLFLRCETKIYRRRFKAVGTSNKLNQVHTRSLKKLLAPIYHFLIIGNFHKASTEIAKVIQNNQVEFDAVDGMIDTATWLQTEIDNYYNNIYEL